MDIPDSQLSLDGQHPLPLATGLPFDDIRALFEKLPDPDPDARARAALRNLNLLKPAGSLGQLEDIALFLAGWQGSEKPIITRPIVALFAGNHGVHAQGVSKWPMQITQTMVDMFMQGGAAINQICAAHGLGLKVFDLALEIPVNDFTREAALDEKDCAATIAFGMEAIAGGVDLICLGEMGIGNTTAASAIYAAMFGGEVEEWVGEGAGSDTAQRKRKVDAIKAGLELHAGSFSDPLEVLRRFGGREIAAMVGTIVSARMERVPVIVDGFVATAAAAVLFKIDPKLLDHCLLGHLSAEKAHARALELLGKKPLLNLGMRLGEGTGAALAAVLVQSAAATHSGMATFADIGMPEVTDLSGDLPP
ncbi:MAG: nicotinate-nucleotide--dimethylbenzimidazole phosphoribosyltransferase [Pseudomonadota bacterium]